MKRNLIAFLMTAAILSAAVVPASAATLQHTRCGNTRQQISWQEVLEASYRWQKWIPTTPCRPCPSQTPTEPEEPTTPGEPTTPEKPGTPEQPSEPEKPTTPPTGDNGNQTTASSMEQEVVALVNAERAKYGLAALTLNTALCDGARMKSQDMANNNYFSHTSPTYGSPFSMMKSLGITYKTAGENIARGYKSAQAVVTAWMNSEGHRANILNSTYTEIGVGYVASGNHWTQWFRS